MARDKTGDSAGVSGARGGRRAPGLATPPADGSAASEPLDGAGETRTGRPIRQWTETLELAAEASQVGPVRRRIIELSRILGFSEMDAHDIGVASSEAISNSVEHARPDHENPIIRVRIFSDPEGICITIIDQGRVRWDPASVPGAYGFDPGPILSPRGRGVAFMRTVMDDVAFEVKASGTRVDLYKRIARGKCKVETPSAPANADPNAR